MRQPIGLYLTEFALGEPVPAGAAGLPCFDAIAPMPQVVHPDVDFDAPALDEGVSDPVGFDEMTAPLELPLELPPPEPDTATVVAALQAEHAAALEAARQQWAAQEGATLAAGLAAALAELETRIADTVAPLLEPFLVQGAQLAALAELRAGLATLLGGGEAAVAVRGPADLLAALRQGAPGRSSLIFTESEVPDVTITLGETRIQSQLAGWARALETALGAPA